MLKDCHIHGFVVIFLDCILRCSVLVDSHACDEIPWQEPRGKQPLCLLSTTKKKGKKKVENNRKRVIERRKDIIEVNHGHQVSNTFQSQVPEFLYLKLPAANITQMTLH